MELGKIWLDASVAPCSVGFWGHACVEGSKDAGGVE